MEDSEIVEKVKNCHGQNSQNYDGRLYCPFIPDRLGILCNKQCLEIIDVPSEYNGCPYKTRRHICNSKEKN